MKVAIIPARGNSVRIPKKNIKPFRGKPIICYAIEAAQSSGLFDRVVVSTDCVAIADVAIEYRAEVFERATDDGTRGTQEVAQEVLMHESYKGMYTACVIYATSPLLKKSDLFGSFLCLNHFTHEVSGTPNYVMSVSAEPLADAGCFYWGFAEEFIKGTPLIGPDTRMYPLPPERCIDINTMEDWRKAEGMYDNLLRSEEGI